MSILRPKPQRGWTPGNRIELLENGEEYFPAVFEAIRNAKQEVIVESFILFDDKVGRELAGVLVEAARRGVSVDVLVDGYGSPDLSPGFVGALDDAGVRLRAFDPQRPLFGLFRINLFRRMHRKIVVVDGEVAFVGGINYAADHLGDFGPEAKQDYAVRLHGPIVTQIQAFARRQIRRASLWPKAEPQPPAGDASLMFVSRDNRHHRDDIERQYRAAIRAARQEVIIANAYFFPGYRLLKTLRQAARRGVKVRLILQGQPDMAIVKAAATLLHKQLLAAGVEIHEYCRRPMHAKVAVIDGDWATVGSSNLDPLSLSLNLESNIIARSPAFAATLRDHLERLMANHCMRLEVDDGRLRGGFYSVLEMLAYHFARHFPSWAGWLPAHRPRLGTVDAGEHPADARDTRRA